MFEWILQNSVVAALAALVVLVLQRALNSRPALTHLLWVMALVVLLMPKLPFLDTPGNELRRGIQGLLWSTEAPAEVASTAPVEMDWREEPAAWNAIVAGDSAALDMEASPAPAPVARTSWYSSIGIGTWLFVAWLVGALLVLGRSAVRILSFQRLVRRSAAAPAVLRNEVERVARRLRVATPEVRILEGVASPSVWCFGRPRLLWPADAIEPDASSARSTIIAHELAHLARRDHWVSWLEVPAAALLFWNPLFWLIRGRIRHFAELSCDAWAVWAYPADRRAFAEALIDMQARTVFAPVALQGLGATDSEFKDFERRLNMIMKRRVSPGVSKGMAAIAMLAAVLVAPGFSDGDDKKKNKPGSGRAVVEAHVESQKWMEKAEELFQAQDYELAIDAFGEVIALNPENGPAHARLGYILVGMGQLEDASMYFKKQYELGHARSTALYNLACAKALGGDTKGALKKASAAVRLGFSNTELMATDSDLASIRDEPRYQELIQLAEIAKELKGELAKLEAEGDKQGFYAAHAELAEILSLDGELLSQHGHLALKAKDYEGAAWAFGRQAEIEHNTPTAFYNRACGRSLAGDLDGALSDLERSATAGMSYGGVLEDSDLDGLRGDPRFAALQERIAADAAAMKELESCLDSGDHAAAMPSLKKMVMDEKRSKKGRAWAAQKLGQLLIEEGRYEDALRAFEHSATIGASIDRSSFHMAKALAHLGDAEAALRHLEYALDLGFAEPAEVRGLLEANALCSPADAEKLIERAEKKAKWGDGYGKEKKKKKAWAAGTEKEKKKYGGKKKIAQDA